MGEGERGGGGLKYAWILLSAKEILPRVRGRNLHTLTLPLGC